MTQYYMAPMGDIVRAAMPAGLGQTSKRRVRLLVSPDDPRLADARKRSSKRGKLIDLLRDHGPMLATELRKKTALTSIHAVIAELERDGILGTEEIIPGPRAKAKVREFIARGTARPRRHPERARRTPFPPEEGAGIPVGAPRTASKHRIPRSDLLEFMKRTRTASATVKPFRESGLTSRRRAAK